MRGKMEQKEKKGLALILVIVTCVSLLAGCGRSDADGAVDETAAVSREADEAAGLLEGNGKETAGPRKTDDETEEPEGKKDETAEKATTENGEATAVASSGTGELISDEEAKHLQYVKKYILEDIYGDGASYEIYAPDGSENSDGFISYIDHGVHFFAMVYSGGGEDLPYMILNETLKSQKEQMTSDKDYSDVQIGEVMKNGADRYAVISAMNTDYYGTPFLEKTIYYMDVPKAGIGVLWELEVDEMEKDENTEPILGEIGLCYGVSLADFAPSGDWEQADATRRAAEQNVYEPEEGQLALTAVDGYKYLGQTTMSFEGGEIQCPVMAPMGRNCMAKEDFISASMHGVSMYAGGSHVSSAQYLAQMKSNADRWYEQKQNDSERNRNVHKSDVMEMDGFENGYYYSVDFEAKDIITEEYHKEINVNCWIVIAEEYVLSCNFTFRTNEYDEETNALLKELETAYGMDLSECYNEE